MYRGVLCVHTSLYGGYRGSGSHSRGGRGQPVVLHEVTEILHHTNSKQVL